MVSSVALNFDCQSSITLRKKIAPTRLTTLPSLYRSSARFANNNEPKKRLTLRISSASAAGTPSTPNDFFNPYEVLGVSPIETFASIKETYFRRRKEAEEEGDQETLEQLEKAYDKLMMARLTNRQKGLDYGSFKVSKDIKYADKQPIVPWGPRFARCSARDIQINFALSAGFMTWTLLQRSAAYKPLQFLAFVFLYRFFEKLRAFEPAVKYSEDAEDDRRAWKLGKRILRSLSLVFGCIAVASLAFTGAVNLSEMAIGYVPAFLYNNQESVVTAGSAFVLFIVSSFYR